MSQQVYLVYDIKGVQSFIFAVPRLAYIVGGSALVDDFDRRVAPGLAKGIPGVRTVFCGGGRGLFACPDAAGADRLQQALLQEARKDGIGLRLGRNAGLVEAMQSAEACHPYIPEDLDGHPCQESGLYPVPEGTGRGRDGKVHPVVERRVLEERPRHFERRLSQGPHGDWISILAGRDHEFFRDATGDPAAAAALGGRNRWAVVCMDGNDMGAQFRAAVKKGLAPDALERWVGRMSAALDRASAAACGQGLRRLLGLWLQGLGGATPPAGAAGVVLPFRPLVVGGDDIVALCHVRHAFDFVLEAQRVFADTAAAAAEEARREGLDLWPATGGRITISAGVLFCPVGYPLHTAIPYAESLLASAKHKGRGLGRDGQPAPACLDWESVTEGLLDTPAARRNREFRFVDASGPAEETVHLTARPYTAEAFRKLEDLAGSYGRLPGGILHQVRQHLRASRADRRLFAARLAKRHKDLARDIAEEGGRWRVEQGARSTDVVDALLLLEERHRFREGVQA